MTEAPTRLVIDWTQMPTYNTIMAVAVGAALMSLVSFSRELKGNKSMALEPWAIGFAVPGFILTTTGLHMTLTWPLAKYFPFDNIIFGETSLGFGVLLLAAAFYLWMRGAALLATRDVAQAVGTAAKPISIFIFGLGLALIAIACAGIVFQLFAAPPEEPLTGIFAPYPWLEATAVSSLFACVGIGALLFPFAIRNFSQSSKVTAQQQVIAWLWGLSGLAWFIFGALNYFTHIGLIIHTQP